MIAGFIQIGEHLWQCSKCNAEISSGIIGISEHWCNCIGKEFYTALISLAETKTIELKDIEDLQIKYLNHDNKT